MSVGKQLLGEAAIIIAGPDLWKHILNLIADVQLSGLTSQEKHDKVYDDLKLIAEDTLLPILNLLIEIGVVFIKSKI